MGSRLAIEIDSAKSGDFGSRQNTPVDTLVLHTTEGDSIESATTWWDHDEVIASAHYVLDGKRVVARVPEGMAAYHAGSRAMNQRSVGIEVVGHAGRRATWTPEVMAQLVTLAAEIVERHHIPVLHQPGPGICGHADVPCPEHSGMRGGKGHHHDPGPFFDWSGFLEAVRAELAPEPRAEGWQDAGAGRHA